MLLSFPKQLRHARASTGSRATICANVSNVISFLPWLAARRTRAAQCGDGIPPGRLRQPLTVDSDRDSAVATSPVPPKSSMISPAVAMQGTLVRTVRTCQEFASRETTFLPVRGPLKPMIDPPEVLGPRLAALRLALGVETQVEFAKAIGVEKNTYNPWENGKRPLTFEGACLIRKKFHIPLDYLFFGDAADELPMKVIKNLRKAA